MIRTRSFEELEIRKGSFTLAKELGLIFYDKGFKNYSFQDQVMRASLSISNNIAEWNDRWSNKDFMKFLFIAKWSVAEVKSMLYIAYEFSYISLEQRDYFLNKLSILMSQIGRLIQYLKNNI